MSGVHLAGTVTLTSSRPRRCSSSNHLPIMLLAGCTSIDTTTSAGRMKVLGIVVIRFFPSCFGVGFRALAPSTWSGGHAYYRTSQSHTGRNYVALGGNS